MSSPRPSRQPSATSEQTHIHVTAFPDAHLSGEPAGGSGDPQGLLDKMSDNLWGQRQHAARARSSIQQAAPWTHGGVHVQAPQADALTRPRAVTQVVKQIRPPPPTTTMSAAAMAMHVGGVAATAPEPRDRSRSPPARSLASSAPSEGAASNASSGPVLPTYKEIDTASWTAVAGQKNKQGGLTVFINDQRSLTPPTFRLCARNNEVGTIVFPVAPP